MAEQRQPFRFRLPWLSAATTAPRPAAEPQPPRPPVETQAPTQPTTTVPIQRPPFRPAGIAPVQPPPPTQAPPRTEPQLPSPPRATNESQVASQPASPSRATTQTQASSVPPSPSRGATESRVTSQPALPSRATTQTEAASQTQSPSRAETQSRAASVPPSPSRTASQPQTITQTAPQPRFPSHLAPKGQTSSQPSSPLRTADKVQPTAGEVSQPASPPKKLLPTSQETSLPPSSTPPPPSTSQQPPKPAVSLQLSQELQPKTQTISETVSKSQNQTPPETTIQPGGVAAQSTQTSGLVTEVETTSKATLETPAAPQKSDSKSIGADRPTLLSESEKRLKEKEGKKDVEELVKEEKTEGKKAKEELKKEEKTKGLAYEEATQRTITKQTLMTSSSDGEQIKTVSATHPKDRNTLQQKPVTSNGERAPLHKEIREDISKLVHKLTTGYAKQPMDERTVSIITLAGENRGATMHLGSESAKKDGSIHIHRGYKLNPDESTEATTDGEGRSEGRESAKPMTKEDQATKAYINNNTQSINNSILFNSSVNERDPGVQLDFSHNPAEPTKSSTKPEPLETHKAEFNITPAEKLTYVPTVRRRCLRGLFMEPSDSDPDDPEKPERHGCRYHCGEKRKDKEIGDL